MPADVNPFEPWRPRQDPPPEPVEPQRDVNPTKPWRPPARSREPEVLPAAQPPVATRPSPKEGTGSNAAMVVLAVVVVVAGLIAVAYLGGPHVPRIGATAAVLCLSGLIVLCFARRAPLRTRLAWGAGGLAAAAAAWALVPTTGGMSLVRAHQLRAEIEQMPVGDLDHFQQTAGQRRELVREYPTFRDDVRNAEQRWAQDTTDAVVEEADDLRKRTQPRAALDRLAALEATLRPAQLYSGDSVQAARQRIVRAWLDDEEQVLRGLIKDRKFVVLREGCDELLEKLGKEARQAGLEGELRQRMVEVRGEGLRANVKMAEEDLARLFDGKDYAAVARRGAALQRSLGQQGRELGLGAELTRPLDEVRKKSLTAWGEKAQRQLEGLLDKGELIEVGKQGARYANNLKDEATALGEPKALEGVRAVRVRAVQARTKKTADRLEAHIKSGELARVPPAAQVALEELSAEATATGELRAVQRQLLAVRRKALRARLERARVEALALVKEDRNLAAEALGQKTEKELSGEARLVGAEAELVAFRKSCEVFGDLARKAKKSDPK
jgi:hypothetical protein